MTSEKTIICGKYTWLSPRGDYVMIGLNENIIKDGQEIYSVNLPLEGDEVEEGDYFITVETAKGQIEVLAPLTGQVLELNEELIENCEVLNQNPYEIGILTVEPDEDWAIE